VCLRDVFVMDVERDAPPSPLSAVAAAQSGSIAGAVGAASSARAMPLIRHDPAREAELAHHDACAICTDTYSTRGSERVGWLPCRHVFHVDCICTWAKEATKCPFCKQPFTAIVDTTARDAWAGPPIRGAGAAAGAAGAADLPTVSLHAPPGTTIPVVATEFRYVPDACEFPDDPSETACLRNCLLRCGYGGRIAAQSFEVQCDKCDK